MTVTKMTAKQADREAIRKWGRYAFASIRQGEYCVGSGRGDGDYGEGDSWEAAFANADRSAPSRD